MARNKRRKLLQKPHNIPSSKNGPSTKYATHLAPQRKKSQRPNPDTLKTPLPFDPSDKILLIGEGLCPSTSLPPTITNTPTERRLFILALPHRTPQLRRPNRHKPRQ